MAYTFKERTIFDEDGTAVAECLLMADAASFVAALNAQETIVADASMRGVTLGQIAEAAVIGKAAAERRVSAVCKERDSLHEAGMKMLAALGIAREFIEAELECRQASMLPISNSSDSAYLAEAEHALSQVCAAIAKAEEGANV